MSSGLWIPIIAGGFTLFGVVIGAILKPLVEQYFDNRRRTFNVRIGRNHTFESPHKELTFHWLNHKFLKLINTSFQITNSTGKTIRGIRIIMEVPARPSEENFAYLAVPEAQDGIRFEMSDLIVWPVTLDINYFESGKTLRGYVLSDYCEVFTIYTPDDYEITIRTFEDELAGFTKKKILELLGLVLMASVIAPVVFSLLSLL